MTSQYWILLVFIILIVFGGCINKQNKGISDSCNCNELYESDSGWRKDGKLFTGSCISYFPDGKVESVAEFVDGKIHGHLKVYFRNGKLAEDKEYKNDVLSGKVKFYHENGKLAEEGNVIANSKEGLWKVYYESGQLMTLENWKHNLMADSSIGYFRNGSLQIKGFWVNGKEEGEWTFYDSITGEVDGFLHFENGVLIEDVNP